MVERLAHLSDEHERAAIESLSRENRITVFPGNENDQNPKSLQVIEK